MAEILQVRSTAFLTFMVIMFCCPDILSFRPKDEAYLTNRGKRACSLVPYDVSCHQRCPIPEGSDWNNLKEYTNCSKIWNGSRFHCAKNNDGKYVNACAVAVSCSKGKEPIISLTEGQTAVAEISCQWCPEGRFNPEKSKSSDTYSKCYLKQECHASHGQVECEVVNGSARHWTDNKCRCDIKRNFIPLHGKANSCTDNYIDCSERHPCGDTSDGRAQEHINNASGYICVPVCGDDFNPRTLDIDDCIPKEIEGNSTALQNVSSYSTPNSAVENSSLPVTVISTTSKGNGNKTPPRILYVVLIAIVVVPVIIAFIVWIVRRRCCGQRPSTDQGQAPSTGPEENIPLNQLQDRSNGNGNECTTVEVS